MQFNINDDLDSWFSQEGCLISVLQIDKEMPVEWELWHSKFACPYF